MTSKFPNKKVPSPELILETYLVKRSLTKTLWYLKDAGYMIGWNRARAVLRLNNVKMHPTRPGHNHFNSVYRCEVVDQSGTSTTP